MRRTIASSGRRGLLCLASLAWLTISLTGFITVAGWGADSEAPKVPAAAPVRPVTEEYFGTKIVDPYRYMENLKAPEVEAWFKAQNAYTRAMLARIPGRDALLARVRKLDESAPARVFDVRRLPAGRYFYQKRLATEDVAKLYMREGLNGEEKLLVDPMKFAKSGGPHWSINYYAPSFDGRYVAFGVSEGGSEDAVIHFFDTQTGHEFVEKIDRGWFGSPAWRPDGHSLYYNRMQKLGPNAPPTEREQKSRVYLHVLGTDPEKDPLVFGYEVSPAVKVQATDIPFAATVPGVPYVLALIAHGVQNEITLYATNIDSATGAQASWRKVCDVDDDVTGFDIHGNDLYLQSHKNASRYKVIRTALSDPSVAQAAVVVPAGEAVIRSIAAAQDALYVQQLDGGIGRVLRVPYGAQPEPVALPFQGSVGLMGTDPRVPGTLLDLASWTKADKIYAYDPGTKQITDTQLQPVGPFDDPPDIESVEVKAKSYDGTMIPLSIIYKKGSKLDGTNPTQLLGYGAYGITLDPFFDPMLLAWLERGGVFAVAHVRGGGEYGEDWHVAGKRLTKPNTWKDFIACAEYLIDQKYTSTTRLGIIGGSAGGITIGRSVTERPDLFAAAIDEVPLSDGPRFEFTPNGPPNVPEFGTVKTEEGFKGLYEMSAYHHVKDGTAYPAVMVTTGFNDPRVISWQPGKMAARLQAATSSGKPVLLRVEYEAGHGIGSTKTQREEELADGMSFLLWQFDEPGFQPPKE